MTAAEQLTAETITVERVAKTIDHSLLRPELTVDEVLAGCELAARYDVASVCCRPIDVSRCVERLAGSDVVVGTVIGFPHGSNLTATKVFEAQRALEQGAVELDMVLQIGLLRSGLTDDVRADIAAVVAAAGDGALVKVILENAYLTDDEKVTGLPAGRGCRRGVREDVDRVRAERRDARRPAPDAGDGVTPYQGESRRRGAHARCAHRLHQRRHRPVRCHRHGDHHRRPPLPPGLIAARGALARHRPRRHQPQAGARRA